MNSINQNDIHILNWTDKIKIKFPYQNKHFILYKMLHDFPIALEHFSGEFTTGTE